MRQVSRNLWLGVYGVVSVLIVVQVVWWAFVFLRAVQNEQNLSLKLARFEFPSQIEEVRKNVETHALHQRVMFLSESVFFVVLSLAGTFLLYRFLRREEQLKVVQKNFIEIMSHESKTPLTALKLRLESLTEKRPDDKDLNHQVERSLMEIRRLTTLFDKAMGLHRLERHEVSLEPISINDLLKEILHRMDPVLKDKKVDLLVETEGEPIVQGDLHGLQNTFQSLIENGIFYNLSKEKMLRIRVGLQGDQVCVKITDNGEGIELKDREKVFERFYRGTNMRGVPGTGLGLYLAKRIVESHHGLIRFIAEVPKGTSFEVLLPSYG